MQSYEREGGREGGRGWQDGWQAGRQGGREGGWVGGWEGERQGCREARRQGGREAGRQGGREGEGERDYEDRLHPLKLPSLYYRRAHGDMIEAYKFTHSIYKTEQEPLQRESNTTTRGHSHTLKKERCNTRGQDYKEKHKLDSKQILKSPC